MQGQLLELDVSLGICCASVLTQNSKYCPGGRSSSVQLFLSTTDLKEREREIIQLGF